jgi:hypothetical protein
MKEVDLIFQKNSKLSEIGSKSEYKKYLKTVFSKSKVQEILFHGTSSPNFTKFDRNFKGAGSGDLEKQIAEAEKNLNQYRAKVKSREERKMKLIKEITNKDAFGSDVAVVFDPKKILILGSRKDLSGFRRWKNK